MLHLVTENAFKYRDHISENKTPEFTIKGNQVNVSLMAMDKTLVCLKTARYNEMPVLYPCEGTNLTALKTIDLTNDSLEEKTPCVNTLTFNSAELEALQLHQKCSHASFEYITKAFGDKTLKASIDGNLSMRTKQALKELYCESCAKTKKKLHTAS